MYQPEKLKARRKELKLTQKEIAEQLGISFQAYSAWERGIKEPSKEKVAQLENILKVPKGYLWTFYTLRKSLQTTSALSATSKRCFEQPAVSFLVCSLIFIEYYRIF